MKILITTITFLAITLVSGQSNYEKGMQKAFDLWKNNQTDEAANLFERIAKAEKDNWLPFYYAAHVHIVKTFNSSNGKEIESRLKKAQNLINEAKTYSKQNAEVLIMEAMLNTAYVVYDSSVYGMTHSPKVEALYIEAKKLEPENPRATLNHAEWQMGAAKYWGKDPKSFCPEIEKAILYFEKDTPNIAFYPRWGKNQIARVQANCK